ncbi:MAG: RecX family transcriptional regulator [bacterium]
MDAQYPAQISKIEVQKKNKRRAAIYLNDEFAFGLDLTIVGQLGLRKGDFLTEEQVTQILLQEEKKKIRDKALRFLAGRAHSEHELKTKLRLRGFNRSLIEEVMTKLADAGLVDDEAFARTFARSRMVNRPVGEHVLRRELLQKGVIEAVVENAISEVYSEKSQKDIAAELFNKHKARYQNLDAWQAKKRMSDFLVRRGFDWEVVKEVVEER